LLLFSSEFRLRFGFRTIQISSEAAKVVSRQILKLGYGCPVLRSAGNKSKVRLFFPKVRLVEEVLDSVSTDFKLTQQPKVFGVKFSLRGICEIFSIKIRNFKL